MGKQEKQEAKRDLINNLNKLEMDLKNLKSKVNSGNFTDVEFNEMVNKINAISYLLKK
ncbi:hypothetical protein R2F61_07435 [Mollicutes bacterium LVI A0078]|nr:hypothetical protein RZE84_07210 [Mollicutes bacterium LVI A0075]WOO90556.1 hypothetical protein R2F61_07435 [Mollicutes bacterium LVI A0078]